jgi:acetyltransferase-like isoleucine patch superfamily enzyme
MHIAKNALQENQKLTQTTPNMSNNEETALDAMITKNPYKEGDETLVELRKRAAIACERYNTFSLGGLGAEETLKNLRGIIDFDPLKPNSTIDLSQASDRIGEHVRISAPFYAEYGFNMRIGSRVTIKAGCRFEDTSNISIGDDTTIGPNVVISGEMHYSDPRWRPWRRGVDIKIGSNVYIGANVTIAPEDTRMDHGTREIIIPDGCYIAPGAVINSPVSRHHILGGFL